MENKNLKQYKNVSTKGMLIMLGFFLVLLVFVLILDIGYIAKTLNFLPIYLFGYSTFALYLLMFSIGVYYVLLTKDKFVPFKWYHVISFIIILISIGGFTSALLASEPYDLSTFINQVNSLFESYYNPYAVPFLFRNANASIGGGLFGYLYSGLFYSLGLETAFILVITVFTFLIGLIIPFIPAIKKGVAKAKVKHENHKREIEKKFLGYSFADLEREARLADPEAYLDKTQKERDAMDDDNYIVKPKIEPIVYKNEIKDTPNPIKEEKVEQNEINSLLNEETKVEQVSKVERRSNVNMKKEETITKVNDLSKQNIKAASSFDNNDYPLEEHKSPFYNEDRHISFYNPENERIGGLTKAHFYKDGMPTNKEIHKPIVNNIPTIEPSTPTNNIVNEVKKEKVEQMTFDFDAVEEEVKVDESVVTAKPTFLDPEEQNLTNKITPSVVSNIPTNTNKEIKPKKERRPWIPIDLGLLFEYDAGEAKEQNELTAKQRMHKINEIFNAFRVQAFCSDYTIGPSVTRYNIECGVGVSVKSVANVINDLSVRLGGVDARFEPIVAGKPYSGLEIPNAMISTVGYKEILEKLPSRDKKPLAVAFGKDIAGEIVFGSLDDFPHMLISGTTGSGKSIFIHSIIMTLIMRTSPDDLKIVLVDPKQVEMSKYTDMPHLLCPIITEPSEANEVLKKLVDEMDDNRYRLFKETGCSDIKQYNEYCLDHPQYEPLPYIVAILDEYSDLVERCKDIAKPVLSIAQKARAAGIHLLVCTQRPSTNIINGVIKGNLPTHVALMTANSFDSMTIIGEGGAEKLLGKGDMLVQCPLVSRVGSVRLQGCFVQNREINRVVECLKNNYRTIYDPAYLDLGESNREQGPSFSATADKDFKDEKYEYVKSIIMGQEYASISKIVREFGFGFTRAGKIFLQLQKEGIVDTNGNASRGCKVLVHDDSYGVAPDISSIESTTVTKISADTNLLPDDEE